MMSVQEFVDGVEVLPGRFFGRATTKHPIMGRVVEVGATCETVKPASWRPSIRSVGVVLWDSPDTCSSRDEAQLVAREHYEASITQALKELFA